MGCEVYDGDLITNDSDVISVIDSGTPPLSDVQDANESETLDSGHDSPDPRELELAICKEAYDLKMNAIEEKCQELSNCCYCLCELDGEQIADCDCNKYFLQKEIDYLKCNQTVYMSSKQCMDDPTICVNVIHNATISSCR